MTWDTSRVAAVIVLVNMKMIPRLVSMLPLFL